MNKNIDGNIVSKILYQELANYLKNKEKKPGIVNITIGNDLGNIIYSNMKNKTISKETNIKYNNVYYDKITYQELISYIKKLNEDKDVTGIMIQLPLPSYLKEYERTILDTISPSKDIDGLTSTSLGLLSTEQDTLIPCTALGIETLLKIYNIPLEGKQVAIINRSNIIGKPLTYLMLRNNTTPIICHSKTEKLSTITKECDIVIAALNKQEYITSKYIKEGAIVIDVGVHKNNLDKIVGDVNYKDVYDKVSLITPPTGSIGPVTICMLAYNSAKCLYGKEISILLEKAILRAKDNIKEKNS